MTYYHEDRMTTDYEEVLLERIHDLECLVHKLEEHSQRITQLDGTLITRLEVITPSNTRHYVNNSCVINKISIQDEGRTMKIFLAQIGGAEHE